MKINRFAAFAWGVLVCALLVILLGVVVRATGSGAGCGSDWPSCNGQIVPSLEEMKTVIEFTHRLTSSGFGLLAIALVVWGFREYPKGHRVRSAAVWSLVLTIVEGLIGAFLVRLELVADNISVARAVWMAGHLANTFLLLGTFTLTAWWASGGKSVRWRAQGAVIPLLGIGFALMMLLGMSGAITALGDTLFPANSLAEGLRQDFSDSAHFLIQLRTIHPVLAVLAGFYIVWAARQIAHLRPNLWTTRLSQALIGLFMLQILLGVVNLVLLAPIWMQLVHLLMADFVWMAFVLLGAAALAHDRVPIAPVGVGRSRSRVIGI
ncbi:MAG: COX15/CtaA family protein [Ardenticatenaceae bacterium]